MSEKQKKLGSRQKFFRLCISVLTHSPRVTIEPLRAHRRYVITGDIEVHGIMPFTLYESWRIDVWIKSKRVAGMSASGDIRPYDKKLVAQVTPALQALVPLEALAEL